ncbi:MAG: flagellin [Chitinivibrionales bacterium]
MRINHNISALVTQGSLYKANRDMGKSIEKLSTGLRINRASDDAAGLAISENLRTQIRGVAQAQRNAQDGIAALNVAEGAANEISDILQRMRELAVQSSNETLTDTERSYTNQEFTALIDEIDRIAGVTNYNNQKLISSDSGRFGDAGSDEGSALWIDANASRGVDSISVTIDTLTSESLGIESTDYNLNSQTGAVDAISALDSAISSVNSMRADIGAFVNRLEHAVNSLVISETNQTAAESQIRDVDFATETSNFTRSQILSQSATGMLAQANMVPQSVLSLLG